jgi:hypothetical protein
VVLSATRTEVVNVKGFDELVEWGELRPINLRLRLSRRALTTEICDLLRHDASLIENRLGDVDRRA